ncbi:protein Ccc1p [Trichomonascus vanleenenianus]|uniref:Ccc1p n=1 Tax=Trichomonascus vanleenenianus TaxID=2268995 RepID=UPI003ECAD206
MLVLLKKLFMGNGRGDKTQLLPTSRSYDAVQQADDSCSDTLSCASSQSEKSSVSPRVMSDMIIGLSDGLTVPFALTAGLSSLGDSKLVITGGLAELVSGAISMGLGGYLAAKSESEFYHSQVAKQRELFDTNPTLSVQSLNDILYEYKLSPQTCKEVVKDMEHDPDMLVQFIIKVGQGLEEPADSRQFTSAATIGLAYFFGGFIPLIPYFFTTHVDMGLYISVIVMGVTLFAFGSIKTVVSLGNDCGAWKIIENGIKMMITGGVAAASAWALVRAIE